MSNTDTGSAGALTKEAVMQEAQERVYRDSDDDRTGDVIGFGEWIRDKLAALREDDVPECNGSHCHREIAEGAPECTACAGSLTDEQTLARAAELLDTQGLSPARDYAADNIRQLLAVPPAQRPAGRPTMSPDECAHDVYRHGQSIGLFDIPKETANAICAQITAVTGARVDWHYVAGRVHMKALPASPIAPAAADEREAFRNVLGLVGRGAGESSVELATIWAAGVAFGCGTTCPSVEG
ncbi:hypothetical protein WK03_35165 [Burkholderia cepacia]|uniref:hypothetical protein n=1 Tax=Burkholderia cepacia TaxID=292 RepID=UPI0007598A0E|nr:hypothetical protein [Burkholderia cepacia]KVQ35711.1 hypothetical protein WK03_35165 [Burkholderia cepacia]